MGKPWLSVFLLKWQNFETHPASRWSFPAVTSTIVGQEMAVSIHRPFLLGLLSSSNRKPSIWGKGLFVEAWEPWHSFCTWSFEPWLWCWGWAAGRGRAAIGSYAGFQVSHSMSRSKTAVGPRVQGSVAWGHQLLGGCWALPHSWATPWVEMLQLWKTYKKRKETRLTIFFLHWWCVEMAISWML